MGQSEKTSLRANVVRFTPDRDRIADITALRICAKSGHRLGYSITSSARAGNVGGAILFWNSRGAERIPIDIHKLQINIVRMPRA